ncbi:cytochrome c [Sandarakinorhabdus sp.]|uniref:c-type cytochrome n=1 Tax=Sandarakinorhabdus sp. TaxID=1916663 RepID=UPI00286DB246|nr:cytochrome c [Sandarakinorhabdus sp.]
MNKLLLLIALIAAPALAAKPVKPASPHPGEQVYREVCQACHMANAGGGIGAGRIPALAGNESLEDADYPIMVVTGGKGAMPWFRGSLTDQQIADVVAYVRSHFNKYKGAVTAARVAEVGVPTPKGADDR